MGTDGRGSTALGVAAAARRGIWRRTYRQGLADLLRVFERGCRWSRGWDARPRRRSWRRGSGP